LCVDNLSPLARFPICGRSTSIPELFPELFPELAYNPVLYGAAQIGQQTTAQLPNQLTAERALVEVGSLLGLFTEHDRGSDEVDENDDRGGDRGFDLSSVHYLSWRAMFFSHRGLSFVITRFHSFKAGVNTGTGFFFGFGFTLRRGFRTCFF